jgi:transposase
VGAVPADPALPTAEELAVLPHGELAGRLAEAYRVIAQLTGQVRELTARVEEAVAGNGRLAARVEALERQAGKDSSTSSKPPSSDSPYRKRPPRDRSLREKGKRAPGRQPGEPGTTMNLVDNPKRRFWYSPAECAGCGTGLEGEEVFASRRHQVTGILPAPEPEVTGHVAQSKRCPCCGEVTEGALPPGIRARAVFGPEVPAQAANLACGNYVSSGRAAVLMADLAGVKVSLG